jgi:CRP-like cAMP-binding protein
MTKLSARHFNHPRKTVISPAHHETIGSAIRPLMSSNHLLNILHSAEIRRLQTKFELITLETGEILYEPNRRSIYAYFPLTAVISLVYTLENGTSAAVGLIGNDGIVGISAILGAGSVPNAAVVQCPGNALKIKNLDLLREFRRGGMLQTILLRFTMALLEQTGRTAVCNRLHPIELQLCRWLLLTHDRIESNDIFITHEVIAEILGASREAVTIALKKLKLRKLIGYRRGVITLINRQELENVVCECYRRINIEYNRLLVRGVSRTFD